MFRPDDTGQWEFMPGKAIVRWYPVDENKPAASSTCHPAIAFELIARELRCSPPALWVLQMYATHVAGAATKSDPLGQRAKEEPVLLVYFSRHADDTTRFVVQHNDQHGRFDTVDAVMEQLKTAVTRWMVEGVK